MVAELTQETTAINWIRESDKNEWKEWNLSQYRLSVRETQQSLTERTSFSICKFLSIEIDSTVKGFSEFHRKQCAKTMRSMCSPWSCVSQKTRVLSRFTVPENTNFYFWSKRYMTFFWHWKRFRSKKYISQVSQVDFYIEFVQWASNKVNYIKSCLNLKWTSYFTPFKRIVYALPFMRMNHHLIAKECDLCSKILHPSRVQWKTWRYSNLEIHIYNKIDNIWHKHSSLLYVEE